MADFIMNEEVDEHGAPARRGKLNKKKPRQALGVSSFALQEPYDIFGDVDEGTPQAPQARFIKDRQVRWFWKREILDNSMEDELSINKDGIIRFLEFMHVQKFDDIIRRVKCEFCFFSGTLGHSGLGQTVLSNHTTICGSTKSGAEYKDEARLTLNQQLFESIKKSLKASEPIERWMMLTRRLNLHFPWGEVGADEGRYKRPKRKSQYTNCCKAGLWEVASKFGYISEQVWVADIFEKDEWMNWRMPPEEMASNFTCAMFETPQAVLKHLAEVDEFSRRHWKQRNTVSNCNDLWSLKDRAQQERLREASLSFGYHNGWLSLKDRNLIEGIFLKGDLQILCTMNTLAHGVNLRHIRIAKCTKEYFIYRKNYKGALNSALLAKSLHQNSGMVSHTLLKQLPGIGIVTAKVLVNVSLAI
ncbi:global transcription factor group B1 [Actinidia rufa]|uniref:Global transcription factor group B1 n=1 Tax=Actinidia rufa TaxID=165716 RepID=A0A7J0DVN4_9ERIC|nr:global transcription factor group B1 [Actinidia rufa]